MTLTILSHTNDGTMSVAIDGKRYDYLIDAMYIKKVISLSRKTPGKALNFLKNKARSCYGTQS